MLRANLQAQIEQMEKELYQVDQDIWKLANIISGLNKQLDILRSNKEDLEYKIEDLKEVLDDQ